MHIYITIHVNEILYFYLYCKGGLNEPSKHIHPLTQEYWFVEDSKLKEVCDILRRNLSSTVNIANLARDMNVSIQLVENLRPHIRGMCTCIHGMHGPTTTCSEQFEPSFLVCDSSNIKEKGVFHKRNFAPSFHVKLVFFFSIRAFFHLYQCIQWLTKVIYIFFMCLRCITS